MFGSGEIKELEERIIETSTILARFHSLRLSLIRNLEDFLGWKTFWIKWTVAVHGYCSSFTFASVN